MYESEPSCCDTLHHSISRDTKHWMTGKRSLV